MSGKRSEREEAGAFGLGEDPLAEDDPLIETLYGGAARPAPPATAPSGHPTPAAGAPSTSRGPASRVAAVTQPADEPAEAPARKRRRRSSRRRMPLRDGQTFRLVTFSFYEDDVDRLDTLLEEARRRGHRKVSRSQIVRLALRQVDLDALPEDI